MDYKSSGVDIEAGENAVKAIKDIVKKTYNKNVLTELGSFGGLYEVDKKWKNPVIVSSTDGVGTKIIVAKMMNKYDTIGQDLVNHCVNDIFVQGGIPQIFNDYIGVEKMNPDVIKQIITGMSKACIENEMSLIGGEMAEMPGIYQNNDLDITGTIIGLVEKENIITGENITKDDVVIGFNSSGLHTNGYSLARNIVFEKLKLDVNDYVEELDEKIGEALLKVHISYYQILKEFAINKQINGMAHITGGGLIGNIKRIIPDGLVAEISCNSWETPKLFNWLVEKGNIDSFEAYQAFNMGIGFVVITDKVNGDIILKETNGFVIGEITDRKLNDKVILKNYEI